MDLAAQEKSFYEPAQYANGTKVPDVAGYTIGQRIRELRKLKKLTQKELATRAGVLQETVSKLERGEMKRPTYDTLTGVAAALGVNVEDIRQGASDEANVSATGRKVMAPGARAEAIEMADKALRNEQRRRWHDQMDALKEGIKQAFRDSGAFGVDDMMVAAELVRTPIMNASEEFLKESGSVLLETAALLRSGGFFDAPNDAHPKPRYPSESQFITGMVIVAVSKILEIRGQPLAERPLPNGELAVF